MRNVIPRLGVAVPDCLTATTYLVAWIAPTQLDPSRFRNLLAAIVIEFLVLHASALYGFGIAKRADRLDRRLWILGGLTVLYLIPITFMAVQLKTDGPILAFFWLFTSRLAFILIHPESAAAETRRTVTLWAISLLAFMVGTIAVNKIPLPALGLTPRFVASLSMSGHPIPRRSRPRSRLPSASSTSSCKPARSSTSPARAGKSNAPRPSTMVSRLGEPISE